MGGAGVGLGVGLGAGEAAAGRQTEHAEWPSVTTRKGKQGALGQGADE